MRKFALTVVLLAALAAPSLAAQSIGIFDDPNGQSCQISDPGGETQKKVYIIHLNAPPSVIGSAWKLTWDAGMNMTWVSESSPFLLTGNSQDGVQVYYYTCQAGTFLIDTVTFTSHGTSAPCSYMRLAAEPTQGLVALYCNFAKLSFVPGEGIVNANASCACTVAAAPTTWGRVKSLYR
jgi:opacity protein-like surface antigen